MFALPGRYVGEALVLLVLGGVLVCATAWSSAHTNARFLDGIHKGIADMHAELVSSYTLTHSNQADEEVAQILTGCADRDVYEKGLSALAQSTPKELEATKMHFLTCGDHDALRKEIMVIKLGRMLATAERLNALATQTMGESEYTENLRVWKALVALERERGELQREQVVLQGEIIDLLLAEKPLTDTLRRAEEVNQSLSVKFHQSSALAEEEVRTWSALAQRE